MRCSPAQKPPMVPSAFTLHEPAQWFLHCGPSSSRSGSTWELVRNARPATTVDLLNQELWGGEASKLGFNKSPPRDSDTSSLLSSCLPMSPETPNFSPSFPVLHKLFTGHQLWARCGHTAVHQTDTCSALLGLVICPPLGLEYSSLLLSSQIPAQPSWQCTRHSLNMS